MKTKMRLTVALLIATALVSRATATALPILTLDPADGALAGPAGSTVGWGFSLTNDTDYLVVSSATFTAPTLLGTFTDFISGFNFFVVGPAPEPATVSQVFDAGLFSGIGSFAINPLALPGSHADGQIIVTYDLFSVSPNDPGFDPDADTLSNGNVLRVDASVTVPSATVPEPATMILISGAMGLASLARRRSQRTALSRRRRRVH